MELTLISEKMVKNIWEEVLLIPDLSFSDDFINLGGHSLQAMQIISRIHLYFGIELTISDLYYNRTISKFTKLLNKKIKEAQNDQENIAASSKISGSTEYPLTSTQQAIWHLSLLANNKSIYNNYKAFIIKKTVDENYIIEFLSYITSKYDLLKASIHDKDGTLIHRIEEKVSPIFEVVDANKLASSEIDEFLTKFQSKPFNLSTAPLFRTLILKERKKTTVLFVIHHIISDAWSLNILLRELHSYKKENVPVSSYNEYVLWKTQKHENSSFDYWREHLKEHEQLQFPLKNYDSSLYDFSGERIQYSLTHESYTRLNRIKNQVKTTPYIILISCYFILLYQLTCQKNITIGTVFADRMKYEFESLIGLCENILPLNLHIENTETAHQLFHKVITHTLNSFKNQNVNILELASHINCTQDLKHKQLFNTMFILDNTPSIALAIDEEPTEEIYIRENSSRLDLIFTVKINNGVINLQVEFNKNKFSQETISDLLSNYENILTSVSNNPEIVLSNIALYYPQTKYFENQYLHGEKIKRSNSINKMLHRAFKKYSTRIAVVSQTQSLTYDELEHLTSILIKNLRSKGIVRSDLIGVHYEMSDHLIPLITAIFDIGAIYVPLDPLSFNEKNDNAGYKIKCFITNTKDTLFKREDVPLIAIDDLLINDIQLSNNSSIDIEWSLENPAYIIHTSGTTSNRLPVLCNHNGLVNAVMGIAHYLDLTDAPRWIALVSKTFDISMIDIFVPILFGGTIYFPERSCQNNPEFLEKFVKLNNITHIQAPPTIWQMLMSYAWVSNNSITALVGGEKLSKKLAKYLLGNCKKVYNLYGPTECSIWTSISEITNVTDTISIGQPIPNIEYKILNKHLDETPINTVGELYIQGSQLNNQYINSIKENNLKFKYIQKYRKKYFRTGDLVRALPNGIIEYISRNNNVIKQNGKRISLDFIDDEIIASGLVTVSKTIGIDTHERTFTATFLIKASTTDEEHEIKYLLLKNELSNKPDYIFFIDKLPTTSNMKIDINKLKEIAKAKLNESNQEILQFTKLSDNNLDNLLLNIWKKLLNLKNIDLTDNFFTLGGNSISATQCIVRLREKLNLDIPIRSIFDYPTASELTAFIKRSADINNMKEKNIQKIHNFNNTYQISHAQHRLIFMQHMSINEAVYNMPILIKFTGSILTKKLENAFELVIKRHDALRTSFHTNNKTFLQHIWHYDRFLFKAKHLFINGDESAQKALTQYAKIPFSIDELPLFRIYFFHSKNQALYIGFVFHHLIFDGWSLGILLSDLRKAYTGLLDNPNFELPSLKYQYHDYAAWHNGLVEKNNYKNQLNFWLNEFKDISDEYILYENDENSMENYEGDTYYFNLPNQINEKLDAFSKNFNFTKYSVLLACYTILLSKNFKKNKIIIGCPISNRTNKTAEKLIGFFVNLLGIKVEIESGISILQYLHYIKEKILSAYNNQDIPFDTIISQINPTRKNIKSPLINTLFVYHNNNFSLNAFDKSTLDIIDIPFYAARFDILLSGYENKDELPLKFEFSKHLFKRIFIKNMAEELINTLDYFLENFNKSLSTVYDEPSYHEISKNRKTNIFNMVIKHSELTPNKMAIIYGESTVNYEKLHDLISSTSYFINKNIISKNKMNVGVILSSPISLVVTILSLMRLGHIYVPITSKHDNKNIFKIIDECNIEYCINDNRTLPLLKETRVICLNFDEISHSNYKKIGPLKQQYSKEICIMYTSGTTSQVKPIIFNHDSLINVFYGAKEKLTLLNTNDFRFGQHTNYSFDASIFEILFTLFYGGTIVHIAKDILLSPSDLKTHIQINDINVLWLTSDMFNVIAHSAAATFGNLNALIVGGSIVNPNAILKVYAALHNITIYNGYGPTECTIFSSIYEIPRNISRTKPIPIGKALKGTSIHILNEQLQPCKYNIEGDIYISGNGVAKPYGKSTDHFVNILIDNIQTNVFRTMDRAFLMYDKNIVFVGRADNIQKINGQRIDLDEINRIAMLYDFVFQAYSTIESDQFDRRFISLYVIPNQLNNKNSSIHNWKNIFENLYNVDLKAKGNNPFLGWVSAYNGKPLSKCIMNDWLEQITVLIKSLSPKKVLEIGAGVGLIVNNLCKECEIYYASDFSKNAIDFLNKTLNYVESTIVKTAVAEAIDLSWLGGQKFDTIILNSICQYFPNLQYLEEVLSEAINNIDDTGYIVIGDIRDIRLKEVLHSFVISSKDDANAGNNGLYKKIQRSVQLDQELSISPQYFHDLHQTFSEITSIEVLLKDSSIESELTKFRYDVILHINKVVDSISPDIIIDSYKWSVSNKKIIELINSLTPGSVLIRNMPRNDISKELQNYNKINRKNHCDSDEQRVSIEDHNFLLSKLKDGYHIKKYLLPNQKHNLFDILLYKKSLYGKRSFYQPQSSSNLSFSKRNFKKTLELKENELMGFLSNYIPAECMPKKIYIVEKFPLTYNGKIDKYKLAPILENSTNEIGASFLKIWREVLKLNDFDHDIGFFELGGDSLAIMQIITLSKKIGINLKPNDFYKLKTYNKIMMKAASNSSTYKQDNICPGLNYNTITDLPFTPLQQAYWLARNNLYQLGSLYPSFYIEFEINNLNIDRLNSSFNQILSNSPALRIKPINDEYYNHTDYKPYSIFTYDFSKATPEIINNHKRSMREKMSMAYKEAGHDYYFSVSVSKLPRGKFIVHFCFDLILLDRIGLNVLLSTWKQLYINQRSIKLKSHMEYSTKRNTIRQSQTYLDDKKYWESLIPLLYPAPILPININGVDQTKNKMKRVEFPIAPAQWATLKKKCIKYNLSPSIFLCQIFSYLLSHWSNSKNFTLNILFNPREIIDPMEGNKFIGCFGSTFLLPIEIKDKSFLNACIDLQENFYEKIMHSTFEGTEVIRMYNNYYKKLNDASMPVVFSSLLRNGDNPNHNETIDFIGNMIHSQVETPYVIFEHLVYEKDDGLILSFDYYPECFPKTFIDLFAKSYIKFIYSLIVDSNTWLLACSIIRKKCEDQNPVESIPNYVSDNLLTGLLKSYKENPDKVFLITPQHELSYAEIYTYASHYAAIILSNYPSLDIVPILIDKSHNQIIAVLATLLSGKAYVPIDTNYPKERILSLLAKIKAKVILTSSHNISFLPEYIEPLVINIDSIEISIKYNLALPVINPASLAYIIFTSGSTGNPKGVEISHESALNTIIDVNNKFSISTKDRIFGVSSLSFDLSVFDIFGALAAGATLLLPENGTDISPILWIQFAISNSATIWNSAPSLYELYFDYLQLHNIISKLRLVLLSGDWINKKLVEKSIKYLTSTKFISLGGATEASIWSIYYPIDDISTLKRIPYGKALTNQSVFIMNNDMEQLPPGVVGEICISGIGLARGYFNNKKLTKEQFISKRNSSVRIYKTGDLGRLLEDGNIEILGRIDRQVKIRGFRIELTEIESILYNLPSIKECHVAKHVSDNFEGIVAFVILNNQNTSASNIKSFLEKYLPYYMLPTFIKVVDQFPKSNNGKIDTSKLLENTNPTTTMVSAQYSPNIKFIDKIKNLWMEILNLDEVNVYDDFFMLGGDSLKALKIFIKLSSYYPKLSLNISALFCNSTILGSAKYIENLNSEFK